MRSLAKHDDFMRTAKQKVRDWMNLYPAAAVGPAWWSTAIAPHVNPEAHGRTAL
jgi:hypothetical protein